MSIENLKEYLQYDIYIYMRKKGDSDYNRSNGWQGNPVPVT